MATGTPVRDCLESIHIMLVQFTLWVGKAKQGKKLDIGSTFVILYTISQELIYNIFCFYTYTLYSLILHLKSKRV